MAKVRANSLSKTNVDRVDGQTGRVPQESASTAEVIVDRSKTNAGMRRYPSPMRRWLAAQVSTQAFIWCAGKLFPFRRCKQQFLDQRGDALADRFVTSREIFAQWRDFIPTDQPAGRLWQFREVAPD